MSNLTGRVCVVTGAGSGIGSGLVRHAVGQGMQVIGADVDEAGLARVSKSLGDDVGLFTAYHLDVRDADAVGEFAEQVYSSHGKVHLLFNNAGVLVDGKSWERPLEDWRWIIDVNLMGIIHGLHHFVPRLLAQSDSARIINTASIGGLLGGGTFMSQYQATKHAVVALTESLYKELALEEAEVTASVLCPAEVATKIWQSDRLRPDSKQFTLGVEEQQFHDAVAGNVAAGANPDSFAAQVFAGIEAGKFWIIPDTAFMPLLQQRSDDIALTRNPDLATPVDF